MEAAPAPAPSAAPAPAAMASVGNEVIETQGQAPAQIAVTPAKSVESSSKWTETFDSDMKDYVTNKGFTDPKAVLESYRNLEKLRGVPQERLLKIPEAADAPEWNEVYSKLGKPATPEGYGLMSKGEEDGGFTDWAKDTFHKLNLTTSQGQSIVEQFNEFKNSQEVHEQERYTMDVQDQTKALQKEWGNAYQQNIARAQHAYRTFGLSDKAVSALEKSIGFDGTMKFMHDLGSRISEHGYVSGETPRGFGDSVILTPDQARARISALKNDPDFTNKYIKGDVKARSEMSRLHEMASASD